MSRKIDLIDEAMAEIDDDNKWMEKYEYVPEIFSSIDNYLYAKKFVSSFDCDFEYGNEISDRSYVCLNLHRFILFDVIKKNNQITIKYGSNNSFFNGKPAVFSTTINDKKLFTIQYSIKNSIGSRMNVIVDFEQLGDKDVFKFAHKCHINGWEGTISYYINDTDIPTNIPILIGRKIVNDIPIDRSILLKTILFDREYGTILKELYQKGLLET